MSETRRANWQLPPGVDPGTWEYLNSHSIAYDYDRYFTGHTLFEFDRQLLERWFPNLSKASPQIIADLGCGSGRALELLVAAGYEGLAVDLSPLMLEVVGRKRLEQSLPIRRVCANLVEMQGIRSNCVDHAICLFSTFGMIKGNAARLKALQQMHRILKPGGSLVIHVHSLWANARFPGGLRWLTSGWLRSFWDRKNDWGDKYYAYRGLNRMFLHVFRRSEITSLLRQAGFQIAEIVSIDAGLKGPLKNPRFMGALRASGWTLRAIKPKPGGRD